MIGICQNQQLAAGKQQHLSNCVWFHTPCKPCVAAQTNQKICGNLAVALVLSIVLATALLVRTWENWHFHCRHKIYFTLCCSCDIWQLQRQSTVLVFTLTQPLFAIYTPLTQQIHSLQSQLRGVLLSQECNIHPMWHLSSPMYYSIWLCVMT